MKYNTLNVALVLFVLSTSMVFSSSIDAFAADNDGRGSSGVGSIEACLNHGQPPNFWPCDTEDEWSGGNITNEAGYREGSSIPVRVDITGLENNTNGADAKFQELIIAWDITKSQANTVKHTFDYVTSFDRNDSPHPCLDALPLDVCQNWVKATIPIPAPNNGTSVLDGGVNATSWPSESLPYSSFIQLPQEERLFTMFAPMGHNITINDIDYLSEGDPSDNGGNTESTRLWVNYTSTSSHVIAAFGAHVASPDDWINPATSVNGKSFQIECEEVKKNGGCDGGQINLDAFDVIFPLTAPELTLMKIVNNTNGGNATSGEWQLTAEHSQNNGRSIVVFGNNTQSFLVDAGVTYYLSENVGVDGYSPVHGGLFLCSVNNQTANFIDTITLDPNEKAICTIENIFDNSPPTADNQSLSTDEDTALPITLTGSDSNPDTLTFVLVDGPTNGTLSGFDNSTGNVTYNPDTDYNGDDSFTFKVNDGTTDSNIATISITVDPVNDAPTADNQSLSTDEDTALPITLTGSDIDPDTLTFVLVDGPTNGTLSGFDNSTGNVTYNPDTDYNGDDSFTFKVNDGTTDSNIATISITVDPVNDAPTADNQSLSTDEDTALPITLTGSDIDPDTLTFVLVDGPTNGTLSGFDNSTGNVTYNPDTDYNGDDSFTFKVNDGTTDSNIATISITVDPVNDAPTADNQSLSTDEDTALPITLTGSDIDPDTLTFVLVDGPTNGTLSGFDNSTGNVTYNPDTDYNGDDSFTFKVNDGTTDSNIATISITVVTVNDPPVAVDDTAFVSEAGTVLVDVLANDTDTDSVPTIDSFDQGTYGSVSLVSGELQYTHDGTENFADSFTYTITDGEFTDTATVSITITPVNDAPVAVDDTAFVSEAGTVLVDVLANDTDTDSVPTIDSFDQGTYGSVSLVSGELQYTHDGTENFADSFTYTITDGEFTDTATVSITITPVNDAPVAVDDTAFVSEAGTVLVDVLANDTDTDSVPTIDSFDQGTYGSVSLVSGELQYTHDGTENFADSFTYTITDGEFTDTATVSITVVTVNDPPVAVDDTAFVSEAGTVLVDVLANDTDTDSVPTIDSFDQGTYGSVSLVSGELQYTHDGTENFADSFTYTITDGEFTDTATVSITITPVNDAPVAVDDTAFVSEAGTVLVDVLANDTDTDSVPTIDSFDQGTYGSVSLVSGELQYTHDGTENFADSFTYTITDGEFTDTATVSITITPVNDAPVAVDDTAFVSEAGTVLVDVLANDTDTDSVPTIDSFDQGTYGSVSLVSGELQYTHDGTENFADSFTYTITDGEFTDTATVSITVVTVNDPPVAVDDTAFVSEAGTVLVDVLANDTDTDSVPTIDSFDQGTYGSVSLVSGELQYTHDGTENFADSFTYTITDGEFTDTATVSITITPVNDAPVAVDDTAFVSEAGTVLVDVLANDTDTDSVPTIDSFDQGTYGSVSLVSGELQYTHDGTENFADSFTYTITDGEFTDTATVSITITPVNDAPVAVDDTAFVSEAGTVLVDVLANDTDTDSVPTIDSFDQGTYGSVSLVSGELQYTHDGTENFADSFTYTITDGEFTDTATVSITVVTVNDPPVAVDDTAFVSEAGTVLVDVLANDTDTDSVPTIDSFDQGTYGSVSLVSGELQYTHDGTENFADSFTYTITDGEFTDTATVSITITPVNDAPVAVDDTAFVSEAGTVLVDVLANDTDTDSVPTIDSFDQGTYGSVSLVSGELQYTHDGTENFADSFTYTITDGEFTDTATVSITVGGINDPPTAADNTVTTSENTDYVFTSSEFGFTDNDAGDELVSIKITTLEDAGDLIVNGVDVTLNQIILVSDLDDGNFKYVPVTDAAISPLTTFKFTVNDGELDSVSSYTMTINVDPENAPLLKLKKLVNTDDGGIATSNDFILYANATGDNSRNFADNGDSTTFHKIFADEVYVLSESEIGGYVQDGNWTCDNDVQVVDDTVILETGTTITCTVTNDDIAPTLKLVKVVDPDDGGDAVADDFTLYANATGQNVSADRDIITSGGQGEFEEVYANFSYKLGESVVEGYRQDGNWSCDSGVVVENDSIILTEGQTGVTCTITNDDDGPSLRLIKTVITDNGGDKEPQDFTLFATATNAGSRNIADLGNSNTFHTVFANEEYVLSESLMDGYQQEGNWVCDKNIQVTNDTIKLTEGQTEVTCTITNNDIEPSLTLIKEVVNDNGGTITPDAFTLTAAGPTGFSGNGNVTSDKNFSAGTYTLSESGPEEYVSPKIWSCEGGSFDGVDKITLEVGEIAVCSITNDDASPGLTLKLDLNNGMDGNAIASDFTLNATGPFMFSGIGPFIESGPEIEVGIYNLTATGPDSYIYDSWACVGGNQIDSETVFVDLGETVICSIPVTFNDNCPNVENPDQLDSDGDGKGDACKNDGGMNHWDTRPTFGVNHETRETMLVDNGFAFNGDYFTITDNHHTPFDQQYIEIGAVNSFEATVYASKDLKVQEFLFGVPQVGLGHLAEMRVEVWFDYTGEISDIIVKQDTEVIDRSSLSISHQKVKCMEIDTEEKCDLTSMSAVFLEPLLDNVMAIKAIDFKQRDQTTYLNDGFDISGDSLNPMATEMIPSPLKGEGLIKVTQNAKYSDYWSTDDGRIFEKNSFGSFKQINHEFKRFQDTGDPRTRLHSGFGEMIDSEKLRALGIFNSTALQATLDESFSHDISIGERITEEMIQEMIIQEHIAMKKLQEMDKQTRWN